MDEWNKTNRLFNWEELWLQSAKRKMFNYRAYSIIHSSYSASFLYSLLIKPWLSETEFPPSIPDSSCQTRKIIFLTRNKPITLESLSIIINRPSDDAIFCRIRHTTVIEAHCQLSACLYLGRQIQPGQWRIVIVVFDSPQKLESFQVIGRINSRVFARWHDMRCATDWHDMAFTRIVFREETVPQQIVYCTIQTNQCVGK